MMLLRDEDRARMRAVMSGEKPRGVGLVRWRSWTGLIESILNDPTYTRHEALAELTQHPWQERALGIDTFHPSCSCGFCRAEAYDRQESATKQRYRPAPPPLPQVPAAPRTSYQGELEARLASIARPVWTGDPVAYERAQTAYLDARERVERDMRLRAPPRR